MHTTMNTQIAKFLGWDDVQANDVGAIIGKAPNATKYDHVPQYSSDFSETIKVVKKLNAEGYLLTLEQTKSAAGDLMYDATFLKEGDNSTYRYFMHSNPIVAILGAALSVADIKVCDGVEENTPHKAVINDQGLLVVEGECMPINAIRKVGNIRTEKFISGNFAYILNITIADAPTKEAIYVFDTNCEAEKARKAIIEAMAKFYNR